MYGLAIQKQKGVEEVTRNLQNDFELKARLSGCRNLKEVNHSEQMSELFTSRRKDSLGLTRQQSGEINKVNQFLAREKQMLRQQTSRPDSLQQKTQKVENMRDSLYKKILNPEQYILYKKKKRYLVVNR